MGSEELATRGSPLMKVTGQGNGRGRSILITAVVAYALYTLARTVPQVAYYWLPQGDFGVQDFNITTGVVNRVEPHSAAADAGLRPGDRIDMRSVSLHQIFVAGGQAGVGDAWSVHFFRGGRFSVATLTARPVRLTRAQILDDAVGQIDGLLKLILGVTLVLLKPGRLTWLFLLSWTGGGSYTDFFLTFPVWAWFLAVLPYTIVIGAGSFLLAMFCIVFPSDELRGWRQKVFPFVVGVAAAGVMFEVARLVALVLRIDPSATDWILYVEDMAAGALSAGALIAYWFESRREPGQARWTIPVVVFVAGLFAFEIPGDLSSIFTGAWLPPPFPIIFGLWATLITIVFAYAILRRGMFDIEFIAGRGLAISTLVLLSVALFIGIEIVFTAMFRGSKAELAVDVAVALAIGFGARSGYSRLIDLIDRTLFRRRFEARERLKANIGALSSARSPNDVEEIVTSGAASALGLASAVFFKQMADGGLLREHGIGWPPDALWHLLSDDRLVQLLKSKAPRYINLRALGWSESLLPPPEEPVLAIPMITGSDLIGVTLYGSRLDCVLPSPDTISSLVELARSAARTYRAMDSSVRGTFTTDLAMARSSP
jgi:hypothetical protein